MAELLWDKVEIEEDSVTEEDIAEAESMGKLPPIKFIGICDESFPREAKLKDYTCYKAVLKWQVDQLLECPPGTPATEKDKDMYEGQFIYDDIMLAHPAEKQGMKNRRILVAKRCGLIDGGRIPKDAWADLIIGKQAVITTEKQTYTDRDGNEKSTVKVKFDGYAEAGLTNVQDSFDDI